MRADTGSVPRSDYRSGRAAEDLHLPRVSVVIPTFNKYEYTRRCLESLRELVYPDIEIIVVDNASIDGTPDKIGVEFPPVRVLRNPTNQGYAAACNAGIHATAGPYILLLNNDTRVLDPFMIQTLVDEMEGDPQLAATGPILVDYDTLQAGDSRRFVRPGHGFAEAPGSCLFVRRSALERVGLFDESFFAYYEDLDLFARLRKVGYRMRQSRRTKIAHAGGATAGQNSPFAFYYQNRGFLVFARRHIPFGELMGRVLLERIWLAVWSMKQLAKNRERGQLSAWASGYWDGLIWLLREDAH